MIIHLSAPVEGLKDHSGAVVMVGFGYGEAMTASSRVGAPLGSSGRRLVLTNNCEDR